jgi:hypothetical protein
VKAAAEAPRLRFTNRPFADRRVPRVVSTVAALSTHLSPGRVSYRFAVQNGRVRTGSFDPGGRPVEVSLAITTGAGR